MILQSAKQGKLILQCDSRANMEWEKRKSSKIKFEGWIKERPSQETERRVVWVLEQRGPVSLLARLEVQRITSSSDNVEWKLAVWSERLWSQNLFVPCITYCAFVFPASAYLCWLFFFFFFGNLLQSLKRCSKVKPSFVLLVWILVFSFLFFFFSQVSIIKMSEIRLCYLFSFWMDPERAPVFLNFSIFFFRWGLIVAMLDSFSMFSV